MNPHLGKYHGGGFSFTSARFLVHKVSLKALTGDTALLKHSKEDESTAAMLQSCLSELLSLVSK